MTRRTHLCVGIAITLPVLQNNIVLPIGALGIIGSVAPDWDFKFKLKHRGITHSLLTLIATSLLIQLINKDISIIWFISYLSHMLLDCTNSKGVPWLIPFSFNNYSLKLAKYDGFLDKFIYSLSLISILLQI